MSQEVRVLGVRVTAQRFEEAVERLIRAAAMHSSLRAHFCTVHSLVEATRDPALAQVFDSATMVCTDGTPVVWLARRNAASADRVAGPDVMAAVCDRGRTAGIRHYFLGGAEGVADQLAQRLSSRYTGLAVAGTFTPPFRRMTDAEFSGMCSIIAARRPDVVWIGLGAPKQEFFAAELASAIPSVVVLPVGAAFDFHAGRIRRAPHWMQRAGLEWLFRLAVEPRRLARRYFTTNMRFVYLIARDRWRARGF